MFQNTRSKLAPVIAAGTALMIGAGSAAAQAVDVTAVTAAIDGAKAPIGLIGAAVLVVLVGVKVYKWIRRAL